MIRIIMELHVVSRGEDGGFWLSDMTPQAWRHTKEMRTWLKSDSELRAELSDDFFMFIKDSKSLELALEKRFPFISRSETADTSWPTPVDLEKELRNSLPYMEITRKD
jgi:hypothetical protein